MNSVEKKEREKAKVLRKSRWWQQIIQGSSCYYCQKKIFGKDVTMDHIVPVSRGGLSSKSNCVPCCKACNNKKSDLTAVDLLLSSIEIN